MRGDFDEDEQDDAPFMTGTCHSCHKFGGICCAKDDVEYCPDCCEHPWSDDDADLADLL